MERTEIDDMLICDGHAESWYCMRNLIHCENDCVLCEMAVLNEMLNQATRMSHMTKGLTLKLWREAAVKELKERKLTITHV